MVDTISDSDIERMDRHVDPTDLNAREIQQAFRSKRSEETGGDLSGSVKGEAREAFAKRIAQKREPVRQEARQELVSNTSEPGANGKRQLYGKDPSSGRNTFVGTAQNIEVEVDRDGTVYGVNQNTGTRAIVGEVNTDARS